MRRQSIFIAVLCALSGLPLAQEFNPKDLDNMLFFIESTFFEDTANRARSVATCNTQECYDAPDWSRIDLQYCDTALDGNHVSGARGLWPDGCIRRWEDQSGHVSSRNNAELLTGRDFGQDDHEKSGLILNCINGHPCARGVAASPPEFPQNTSFEIEVVDQFHTTDLTGPFSIFHLVKPISQAANFWYFGHSCLRGLRHTISDDSLYYQCSGGGPTPCTGQGNISEAHAVEIGVWQLIEIHRDSFNNIQVLVNGNDVTLSPQPSFGGNWAYADVMSRTKGADAFLGDLAASIVYGDLTTETERQNIRDYLNGTYNFMSSQPPAPPEDLRVIDSGQGG